MALPCLRIYLGGYNPPLQLIRKLDATYLKTKPLLNKFVVDFLLFVKIDVVNDGSAALPMQPLRLFGDS